MVGELAECAVVHGGRFMGSDIARAVLATAPGTGGRFAGGTTLVLAVSHKGRLMTPTMPRADVVTGGAIVLAHDGALVPAPALE